MHMVHVHGVETYMPPTICMVSSVNHYTEMQRLSKFHPKSWNICWHIQHFAPTCNVNASMVGHVMENYTCLSCGSNLYDVNFGDSYGHHIVLVSDVHRSMMHKSPLTT